MTDTTRVGAVLRVGRVTAGVVASVATSVALFASTAVAHAGALRLGQDPPPVPTWLVVMTGGGVIGMSFLFASMVTDHALIREINGRRVAATASSGLRRAAPLLLSWASVLVLIATVAVAAFGPQTPTANAAVLFVWAGWWAGYTASVYLLGNTWPLLNPWRRIARAIPWDGDRTLPGWLGAWPAVVGLLGLIWIEVVTPVADDPRFLAGIVVAYSVVTVAGATVFGVEAWFARVDPIARVFAVYGRIAPVQRTESGLELRLPGSAAADADVREAADPAFVVAVLWATTYDGLVSTPTWRAIAAPLVDVGLPARLLYLAAIVAGFGLFLALYRLGARLARRTADTYLDADAIADEFATSLLPIAAGYHAAHFLAYVISLLPALVVLSSRPFDPPATLPLLAVPGWFGVLGLLFILVGHVLAIWIAHSIAFDLFSGRLQPLRSQYALVTLMIAYTMTSMWIVIQPTVVVPYV